MFQKLLSIVVFLLFLPVFIIGFLSFLIVAAFFSGWRTADDVILWLVGA